MAQFNVPGGGYIPNNGYMQQPNQMQMQQQQQSNSINNSNIIWVQGIEGAKAYPLPPGFTATLWDIEKNLIYIKIVDMAGIPQPIRVLDYTERAESQEQSGDKGYITEQRLNEILDEKFASFAQGLKSKNKKYNNQKGGKNNGESTI